MGTTSKSSLGKTALSQKTNSSGNIVTDINENDSNKSESFTKIKE